MSLRRILKALDLDLTTSEKMILVLLSDNANDETGECWPSQKYLANRAGMSRQNVNLIINRLREKGHISFEHRKGEKGPAVGWNGLENKAPLRWMASPPYHMNPPEALTMSHLGGAFLSKYRGAPPPMASSSLYMTMLSDELSASSATSKRLEPSARDM